MSNKLYTFEEAMQKVTVKQVVVRSGSMRNEQGIQYGIDNFGQPFWTAGFTVGGKLDESRMPSEELQVRQIWEIHDR